MKAKMTDNAAHYLAIISIASTILFSGCSTSGSKGGIFAREGRQAVVPTNFYINPEAISEAQRVVIMPVHAPQVGLASETDVDEQFISKLSQTQLFEVVTIYREDLTRRFGKGSFNSALPLSEALLEYIKDTSKADAVAFFDITSYHPFQPIKVGVRAKLIRLEDNEVIWAADELFDASLRTTEAEILEYEKKNVRTLRSSKNHDSTLISPIRFVGYCAEKTMMSLPDHERSDSF